MRLNEDRSNFWNLALALIASLICALGLFRQLTARSFLCGVDGYYYALQADSWARTGQVKIPDSSVVPRVMGLIQRGGFRTETAVRLGWVGLILLTWFAFLPLILKVPSVALRWLTFAWVLVSPSLVFNAIEFPRMFLAFTMMPLWFIVLRKWGPFMALTAAWGTFLLHKGIAPFALIFSLSLFMARPRIRRHWLIAIALLGALVLIGLGLKDHLRWGDLSSMTFHPGMPGLWVLMNRSSLPMSLKVELVGSLILALMFAWRAILLANHPQMEWLGIAFLMPALMPVSGSEIFGASERWAVIYPMTLMTLIAFELGTSPHEQLEKISWRRYLIAVPAMLLAVCMTASVLLAYGHPPQLDPDYAAYEQVVRDLTSRDIPMLIAHRGLNFYYKFRLRRESFPFDPEQFWDHKRIWRLTYRITPAEMNYYLPENCRFGTGQVQTLNVPDYLLIREDCWDAFRNKVRLIDDDDLHSRVFESWQNPSQKRPGFLYAKHAKDATAEFPAMQ